MPIYEVVKSQDAYVEYVRAIEADSPEQAVVLASHWEIREGAGWIENGNINLYDHSEVFPERVTLMEEDTLEAATQKLTEDHDGTDLHLEPAERDIIIAALRHWQASTNINPELYEIAENGRGRFLSDGDIDELIETKVNV